MQQGFQTLIFILVYFILVLLSYVYSLEISEKYEKYFQIFKKLWSRSKSYRSKMYFFFKIIHTMQISEKLVHE